MISLHSLIPFVYIHLLETSAHASGNCIYSSDLPVDLKSITISRFLTVLITIQHWTQGVPWVQGCMVINTVKKIHDSRLSQFFNDTLGLVGYDRARCGAVRPAQLHNQRAHEHMRMCSYIHN